MRHLSTNMWHAVECPIHNAMDSNRSLVPELRIRGRRTSKFDEDEKSEELPSITYRIRSGPPI